MSKEKPLFSVIVPAYNSAEFLSQCIESVRAQSFEDFELVLVDDGSKDETLEIFKSAEKLDSRIKVFHQENGGHTSARNLGLTESTGRYILFLDSDDWLDTNVLEACAARIDRYRPDVIVYRLRVAGTDRIFENSFPDGFYNRDKGLEEFRENLLQSPQGTFAVPKSLIGKVMRREVLWSNQLGIPKEVVMGEDGAAFVATMMDADSVCLLSDACYNYRIRPGSVSRTADKMAFRRTLVLLRHYRTVAREKGWQIEDQLDRDVVLQLYTAVQFVTRSGCEKRWLKEEYRKVVEESFVHNALKTAVFNKKATKMRVKQYILRCRAFWLVKLLDHSDNYAQRRPERRPGKRRRSVCENSQT